MNPYGTTHYASMGHDSGPLFRARDEHRKLTPRELRAAVDSTNPHSTLAAQLESLADFHQQEERRDCWRHATGLDGNGHGQLTHEPEGAS